MAWLSEQIRTVVTRIGEITNQTDLETNLTENAIPDFIGEVKAANYREFLDAQRKLMASMIRGYYEAL